MSVLVDAAKQNATSLEQVKRDMEEYAKVVAVANEVMKTMPFKRPARVKLRMKAWRGGASEKVVKL